MRLRLDIGYDGTDFHGWAAQPGLRTVQDEIEAALGVLIRAETEDERPRLVVGGRTDAGVHARGQVAHVDVADEFAGGSPPVVSAACSLGGAAPTPSCTPCARCRLRSTRASVSCGADLVLPLARREWPSRSLDRAVHRRSAQGTRSRSDAARERRTAGPANFTTFCKAREGATAVREAAALRLAADRRRRIRGGDRGRHVVPFHGSRARRFGGRGWQREDRPRRSRATARRTRTHEPLHGHPGARIVA